MIECCYHGAATALRCEGEFDPAFIADLLAATGRLRTEDRFHVVLNLDAMDTKKFTRRDVDAFAVLDRTLQKFNGRLLVCAKSRLIDQTFRQYGAKDMYRASERAAISDLRALAKDFRAGEEMEAAELVEV